MRIPLIYFLLHMCLAGQSQPTNSPFAKVSIFDGPDACGPAVGSIGQGAHYGGQLCVRPIITQTIANTWRKDFNFGGESQALTAPTFVHGYSFPSPFSATNRYVVVNNNGWHYALDRTAGTMAAIPITSNAPLFDAYNDDILYYPTGSIWRKYSISKSTSTILIDLTSKLGPILNGGSTHMSSDNWTAFWTGPDHQVCAMDFSTTKLYCADYKAPETDPARFPWGFIDYSIVTDIDKGTGKRYVMLMAYPTAVTWSVDVQAGVLRFVSRAGENTTTMGFNNPKGNQDGKCDPGENCMSAPHADATQIDGIQYLITVADMSFGTCERDLVALPIAAGADMMAKRIIIAPLGYCSSLYEWPDFHVGCAPKVGSCVISTETVHPAPYGNQILYLPDFGHLVKMGFHLSAAVGSDTYWAQSRAALSPDGRYIAYTSNSGQADEGNGVSHEQVFLMPTTRK